MKDTLHISKGGLQFIFFYQLINSLSSYKKKVKLKLLMVVEGSRGKWISVRPALST